jgi:hypothetical protein
MITTRREDIPSHDSSSSTAASAVEEVLNNMKDIEDDINTTSDIGIEHHASAGKTNNSSSKKQQERTGDEQHEFHLMYKNLMGSIIHPSDVSNIEFDFTAISKKRDTHLNNALDKILTVKENCNKHISDFKVEISTKEMIHRQKYNDEFNLILKIFEKEENKSHSSSSQQKEDLPEEGNDYNQQQLNYEENDLSNNASKNGIGMVHNALLQTVNCLNYKNDLNKQDKVIDKIQHYLSEENNIYLVTLREQEQTLRAMTELTANHLSTLQKICRNEERKFEELWQDDWMVLTDEHQKMIKYLHNMKDNLLRTTLSSMKENVQKKKHEILKVYDEESEALKLLRLQLQEKLSKLEQEWSFTKCSSLVNADQLQYDNRELSSQNTEIENRIKKTKRCIIKLKEDLNREFGQSKLLEEKDKKKIKALEFDCLRLDAQFNNLLTKIQRFEDQEGQKFMSARSMHSEEANDLHDKVRKIHLSIWGLITEG